MTDYSKEELGDIINSWKDNEHEYRKGSGRKFLSQSDIGPLLNNPKEFRNPGDQPLLSFLQGSYFHESILEPHKIEGYKIVDASSRSTNIYKDAVKESGEQILLLKKEKAHLDTLVENTLENKTVRSLIKAEGNIYEKPGVVKLFGEWFKGRADIVCPSQGLVLDLKTSTELGKFKYKSKQYLYTAQAYVYSKMFGLDFVFIVVCKNTGNLGIFECADSFIQAGELSVERAVDNYRKFYKDKTPEETKKLLSNHLLHQELY